MKNGTNYKWRLLFLIFWTFMVSWVHAQPNLVFYPLNGHFNSFEYNPAFLTSPEKFTFSMFPLAGMNISTNNQEAIRDMASKFLSGVVTQKDYDQVIDKLLDKSTFHENVEGTFLSFTYRSKAGFFNFGIKDRQFIDASIEGKLIDFTFSRDIQSVTIGRKQYLPIQAAHYREYSLGYAHTSKDKRLSAGIRGKLYFGKFAFYSNMEGSIQNLQNDYGLVTTGLINISFPSNAINSPNDSTKTVDFSNTNIRHYLWNSGNPGIGVDLGLRYRISPKVNISMSVIDLGKINWKNDLNSRKMDNVLLLNNNSYKIDTLEGVPTITKWENYRNAGAFDFLYLERDSSTSFSRALPMTIYVGMNYQVDPTLALSITDRYVVRKHLSYNSLLLAATFKVNKKFSFSTGYSMIGDTYFNVPLALLFECNFGQIYFGTDNLTSLGLANSSEFASVSFGACFYLFTHRNLLLKRSDNLPFYQPRKTIKNRGTGLLIKAPTKD